MKTHSITAVCCMLINFHVYSQAGSLDLSFSNDGKVTTGLGSGDDFLTAMAYQTDGKIIVAGSTFNGLNYDIALVRYKQDGTTDNTFSQDGKIVLPFGTADDKAEAVLVTPDGKIIIAGSTLNSSLNNDFILVKFNSDGSLDSSFGTAGITTIDFGDNDGAACMALDGNGKIIVAGVSGNFDFKQFALCRINSDGSLDNSFSNDGKETTAIGNYMNFASDLAVSNEGKIIVAGSASNNDETDYAVLARYNNDGTIDYGFGSSGNGRIYFDQGTYETFNSISLLNDGRILAAGNTYIDLINFDDILLVRYTPDGLIDNSFANNGIALTHYCTNDYGNSLVIQSDNKIVIAGGSFGCPTFVLFRYTENGVLDNSFGTSGVLTTDFGANDEVAQCLIKQDDGKLVAAGYRTNVNNYDFALARYDNLLAGMPATDSNKFNLHLFPNPTNEHLTVELNEQIDEGFIDIYTMLGHRIISQKFTSNKQIVVNTARIIPGPYYIKVSSKEGQYNSLFIKN